MGYGVINTGANVKQRALSSMQQTSQLESNRNEANKNIKAADSSAKKTNAAAGVSTGAMIGGNMATGMGLGATSVGLSALASGGVGLGVALLLSELF